MALLEVKEAVTGYGQIPVLRGISLAVEAGEAVGVLGPNGSGKSTLLRLISGLLPLWRGDLRLSGRPLRGLAPEAVARKGVVHVPEGSGVFASLSVAENLRLSLYARPSPEGFAEDLDWVLDLFPRLRERYGQKAGTLSGGEQRMLAIARALLVRPRLLLLDEPSLGLAPAVARQVFQTLAGLCQRRLFALVLVEQNVNLALGLVRRAYVLRGGEVALEGEAETLWHDPEVRRLYLGVT
ncbi:ABC transporter ATP-binding protein [Thermus sp. FJN-A]